LEPQNRRTDEFRTEEVAAAVLAINSGSHFFCSKFIGSSVLRFFCSVPA
jgi:hypothetical protein